MRRALIVSIAIVTLFASSAVMAGEQQVSDRLLEILKERQIISENEFAELSDLADQMKDDQNEVDQQLEALDASISEYLAEEGDADEAGVAVKHMKGKGFGFATGNFELWVGGLFQFQYYGLAPDDARNTNNFDVEQARFYFKGKAFVEGFDYYFQFDGSDSVTLLDAWANYEITDGVQVRMGQFKTPYSRQYMTSTGKLGLMNRSVVVDDFATKRDIGIMLHDVAELGENGDMAVEWAFALVNGDGTNVDGNDNNWFGWVARLGFYPMGMVKYGESDLANTQDLKFGVAGSYASYRNRYVTVAQDLTQRTDSVGIDAVVAWSGLYVTGEWHKRMGEEPVGTSPNESMDDRDDYGWFVQAGFVIPDTEFEVLGRFSAIQFDSMNTVDTTAVWELGVAWYPGQEGHPFKALLMLGQSQVDYNDDTDEDMFFVRAAFQLDW